MKRHVIAAVVALVGLGVLSGTLLAKGDVRPGDGRRHAGTLGSRLAEKLDLSEEQQEKVSQIFKEQREALTKWREENHKKLQGLRANAKEARKAGDKEAAEAAREKIRKILETRKQLHEGLMERLGKVLSDEQMKKAKQIISHRRGRGRGMTGAMHRLDLSEEQKAEVKKILSGARAKAKEAEEPSEKREIMKAARAKISKDVLTDEQRQRLEKMKKRGPFAGLDLTEQQRAKVKEIMQDARKKAAEAETREEKREIFQAARKKVAQDVLTDEQREKLKGCRQHRRKGRGGWGKDDAQ